MTDTERGTMTRVSREQVEDVLMLWEDVDAELLEAICRDWLDMQARERRLVEERDEYRQRLIRIEGWALQASELMDRIRWTKNYDGATDQEATDA
jgi:uncharacterized protein YydD (DUF2326 family)